MFQESRSSSTLEADIVLQKKEIVAVNDKGELCQESRRSYKN